MAKHRVEFVQFGGTLFQHLDTHTSSRSNLGKFAFLMWQEFMQWRVKQADGDGKTGHHFENGGKVLTLFRQQFVERNAAALFIVRQDHLAHSGNARGIKEHMLRAAQANAFCTKIARRLRIQWRFGVGADFHPATGIGPDHQRAKITHQLRLQRRDFTRHHFSGGTIKRDDIAFMQRPSGDAQRFARGINLKAASTRYARTAHATCDNRRMARHAATCGQNAGCGVHAVNVFWAGFNAHQNDGLAALFPFVGSVGVKHNFARSCAGRRRQARGQHIAHSIGIQRRVQQLVQRHRVHPQDSLVRGDEASVGHIDRDFQRCLRGALARSGLQHPQFFTLNGEFNILHIAIMRFEDIEHARQFGVDRGHRFFHRQGLGTRALACRLGQILRGTDTRDNVFALRIDEIFAIISILAGRGIAGEGHARCRRFAHVTEHHRLHIDRSAPVTGDIVQAAIDLCPVGLP